MLSSASRKPVVQLMPEDLNVFPAWEFCLDEEGVEGQDETWVRPISSSTIPEEAWSVIVAARFMLNDGSEFDGFVDVTTASTDDLADLLEEGAFDQPGAVVFIAAKQVHVPTKSDLNNNESRKELERALARDFNSIFPITYLLRMLVEGETQPRSGILR